MWPLAFWDCGFESHRRQWCLSVVKVVYCQVELSASGWSLVRRSLPIVVCPSAIVKFRSWGDSGPLGAVALKDKSSSPKKKTLHSFLLLFHYFSTRIHNNRSVYHIYFHGPAFPSGPHHSVGFTITLKPTTHGRTPLEEWSVEQSELYLTTHSTHKRQDIRVPGEIRTRTPSNRATANPRIRPHGHWERLCHYNRRGFHISSWCQTVSSVLYQPSCCICLHPRDSVEVWCRQCFPAALQTDDKHSAADVTDMAKNLRRLFSYEVKNLMIFFFDWFSYLETRSGSRLAAVVVAHCKRPASVWFCGRFIRTTAEWIQIQVSVYSYVSFSHCDLSHISDVIISDTYFIA